MTSLNVVHRRRIDGIAYRYRSMTASRVSAGVSDSAIFACWLSAAEVGSRPMAIMASAIVVAHKAAISAEKERDQIQIQIQIVYLVGTVLQCK